MGGGRPHINMYFGRSVLESFLLGTLVWCAWSWPSSFLVPFNTIFKYLACVIYPNVDLTGCFPDLHSILQNPAYPLTIILLYFIICQLWSRKGQISESSNKVRKNRKNTNEYNYSYLTWSLLNKRLFYPESISPGTHPFLYSCYFPFKVMKQLNAYNILIALHTFITRLHIHVNGLLWRITSHQVRLHIRIWLFIAEWMCQKWISDHGLVGLEGPFMDVLRHNKAKFLIYKAVPWRMLSRVAGRFHQLRLPVYLRNPLLGLYVRLYGCCVEEATITDLREYPNLSIFFRRSLKPNARPVNLTHSLTSPSDGRVLFVSPVEKGVLEQVKGVHYSLKAFIGFDTNFMRFFSIKATKPAHQPFTRHGSISSDLCSLNQNDPNDTKNPDASDNIFNHCNGINDKIQKYSPIRKSMSGSFNQNGMRRSNTSIQDLNRLNTAIMDIDPENNLVFHPKSQLHTHIEEFSGEDEDASQDEVLPLYPSGEYVDELPPISEYHKSPTSHSNSILWQEIMYAEELLVNQDYVLHQCIIYLAPGDYHRFHSPVDWTVYSRRHFTGELFSVNPGIASWLQGVFTLNERAMYVGRWKHGFFSMTAVGATNVGTINVFFDKHLQTNLPCKQEDIANNRQYKEANFQTRSQKGVSLKRGELMGEFNIGSTIVLLFEAPPDFQMKLQPGDKVKYGEGLEETVPQNNIFNRKKRRRSRISKF